jgi:exonuclease III
VTKGGEVFAQLFPTNPDVVLLQETNVRRGHLKRLDLPPGWVAVFSKEPYKSQRGKGVAIAVRCAALPPRGLLRVVLDISNRYLDVIAVNILSFFVKPTGRRLKRYKGLIPKAVYRLPVC